MKLNKLMIVLLGFSGAALANGDEVTVKITSLTNTRSNGSLEACGTAVHSKGVKPLLVTLKHDESYYTTLTGPNDVWCILFKRWTYDGAIAVGAKSLHDSGDTNFSSVKFLN